MCEMNRRKASLDEYGSMADEFEYELFVEGVFKDDGPRSPPGARR